MKDTLFRCMMFLFRIFKMVLGFLFLGFSLETSAATYYVSNRGNDQLDGSTPATAWKSLDKINSYKFFKPGDRILLNRGDIFYGGLHITTSGTPEMPIVYSAYGFGEKPVISGLYKVLEWKSRGGNIWESADAVSSLEKCNLVLLDRRNTPMGRFPNTGYLTYKVQGERSISSLGLVNSANWTGADIVMKKVRWTVECGKIKRHAGSTIDFDDAGIYQPTDGFGFFIQNDIKTLDTAGEWYYNPETKKVLVYSIGHPANVEIARVKHVLQNTHEVSDLVVENIIFEGSNEECVRLTNLSNFVLKDCVIRFSGTSGIYGFQANQVKILNNDIRHSNGSSIKLTEGCFGALIQYNQIVASGLLPGQGKMFDFGSIFVEGDACTIEYNEVDSSGYNGILFKGNHTLVKNNSISASCLLHDDGAGIYTEGRSAGRKIIGNVVLHSRGNSSGTNSPADIPAHGIYIDEKGTDILVDGNTVSGCTGAGIFVHGAENLIVRNNTVFDNGQAGNWLKGALMLQDGDGMPVQNLQVYGNIFVAKKTYQVCLFVVGGKDQASSFGNFDRNFYIKPSEDFSAIITDPGSGQVVNHSLEDWQLFSGQDKHSFKWIQPAMKAD